MNAPDSRPEPETPLAPEETADAGIGAAEQPSLDAAPPAEPTISNPFEPLPPSAEDETEDRLFGLVTFGLMVLLLICVVLALIADRRPPAGL